MSLYRYELEAVNNAFVEDVAQWLKRCQRVEESIGSHPVAKTLKVMRLQMATAVEENTTGTYPVALRALARATCALCSDDGLYLAGLSDHNIGQIGELIDSLGEAIEKLEGAKIG